MLQVSRILHDDLKLPTFLWLAEQLPCFLRNVSGIRDLRFIGHFPTDDNHTTMHTLGLKFLVQRVYEIVLTCFARSEREHGWKGVFG